MMKLYRGAPAAAIIPPTMAERSLRLRSLMIFGGQSAGDVASPDWLRQFAACGLGGGVSTAPPRLTPTSATQDLSRREPPLVAGSLLVAPSTKAKKLLVEHGEARIIERLRCEPVKLLERLSPLVLYTVLFPCIDCARTIAQFVRERPGVHVEISYEEVWERYETDAVATSFETLRDAGVDFASIADLAKVAREEGADACIIPTDNQPVRRRAKPRRPPDEIAQIRVERAAKRAAAEAEGYSTQCSCGKENQQKNL